MVVPLALGLGYFFLGNFVFVPLVNQGSPVSYVYEYFAPLGNSMGEVLLTVVTRPIYTIEQVFSWQKVGYVLLLLVPLAGLPLLAPRVLVLGLPLLAINLLATKTQLSDVRYWYSMLLVGPLIIATIDSIARLIQHRPLHQRPWLLVVPLLVCLLFAQWQPRNPVISLLLYHEPPQRVAAAHAMLALIADDEARVAATSRLAPHLLRRYIYYYPLAHPQVVLPDLDYIAADVQAAWRGDPNGQTQYAQIQQSNEWCLIYDREGFQLHQRRTATQPDCPPLSHSE
ncbi:MAG: DUF2079 domain-containing protein [Chloroflexaceae bacterium]|nr:DUF2079 domain-containing protein [Chloroflexaceae bacterium]